MNHVAGNYIILKALLMICVVECLEGEQRNVSTSVKVDNVILKEYSDSSESIQKLTPEILLPLDRRKLKIFSMAGSRNGSYEATEADNNDETWLNPGFLSTVIVLVLFLTIMIVAATCRKCSSCPLHTWHKNRETKLNAQIIANIVGRDIAYLDRNGRGHVVRANVDYDYES